MATRTDTNFFSTMVFCNHTTHSHTHQQRRTRTFVHHVSISVCRTAVIVHRLYVYTSSSNKRIIILWTAGPSLNQQRRLWANECLCLCDRYESDTQRSSSTSVKGFKRSAKEFYCFQIEFSILKIKM